MFKDPVKDKLEGTFKKDTTKTPLPGTTAKPPATPHAKPRGEGESDESYNKRVANHAMSQERLSSVGITGGVNKASKEQVKSFSDKYGHGPSGLKKPGDTTKPDMSAENPSKAKNQPSKGSEKFDLQKDKNNIGKTVRTLGTTPPSKKTSTGKPSPTKKILDGAQKAMSNPPRINRKMRRMKRKLASKKPLAGAL